MRSDANHATRQAVGFVTGLGGPLERWILTGLVQVTPTDGTVRMERVLERPRNLKQVELEKGSEQCSLVVLFDALAYFAVYPVVGCVFVRNQWVAWFICIFLSILHHAMPILLDLMRSDKSDPKFVYEGGIQVIGIFLLIGLYCCFLFVQFLLVGMFLRVKMSFLKR